MDKKNALNEYELINMPLLDVDINDERAFLVYSIISTVLTVSPASGWWGEGVHSFIYFAKFCSLSLNGKL